MVASGNHGPLRSHLGLNCGTWLDGLESLEEGGSLEDLGLEEFEAAQGHVEVLFFKVQDHPCNLRGNSAINV